MKEQLIEELMGLPEAISIIELDILDKNKKLQEINDLILDKEAEIKSNINAAQDDSGKKLYSNDQARQLAFISDCKDDTVLSALYLNRTKIQNSISSSKIAIEKFSNHQRNIRAVIDHIN